MDPYPATDLCSGLRYAPPLKFGVSPLMIGPRKYTSATHDFFGEVAALIINLASFNTATEAFNYSVTTIPNARDHAPTLFGRVVHATFPIHDLMHSIVRNNWPEELNLTFVSGSSAVAQSPGGVHLQSDAIANMIIQLVGTAFLKYYERNSQRAKRAFTSDQKLWPEEWRFAWLLRNAIAHGDRWAINDPAFPETCWHGVKVLQSDSGQCWFNSQRFIGGGDVLLLLEELNASPI